MKNYFKMPFTEYVDILLRRQTLPPPNFISNQVVGRNSIKHELNDFLKRVDVPKARSAGDADQRCSDSDRTLKVLADRREKVLGVRV